MTASAAPATATSATSGTATKTMTQDQQQKLEAIHQQLQDQMVKLTSSTEWLAMLQTAAKFHQYSLNNQMLIMLQRPDATRVAGFKAWKALGRSVSKGEKGIAVLAPMKRTIEVEDETTGEKGKAQRIVGFRLVHVFDISQTTGAELPDVSSILLEGEGPEGLWEPVQAFVESKGWTVERGPCGMANGYADPRTKSIRVRRDVSPAQAAKTLIHEAAHVILGHTDNMAEYGVHRGRMEVEAESVAYVVLTAAGADPSSYSLPYLGGWSGGDVKVIEATATRVVKAAHEVMDGAGLVRELEAAPALEVSL